MQDEVRYQKTVLKKGKDLRLAGSLGELEKALKDHSSAYDLDAANIPTDPPSWSNEDDEDVAVSQPKHSRLDSHGEDQDAFCLLHSSISFHSTRGMGFCLL